MTDGETDHFSPCIPCIIIYYYRNYGYEFHFPLTARGMLTQNHSRTPGPQPGLRWPPVGCVLLFICGHYLLLWCWVPVETLDMMNEQYTDNNNIITTINFCVHMHVNSISTCNTVASYVYS